ncbi:hypothetical protein FJY63_13630, partial [Candidatus Sumerlaeota bacterium]|nr:hypothetical protein [Candidatus Sumerlaeota bacterium]
TGLGPLGRLFDKAATKTPIRELVRSRISNSLGEADVPVKLYPGAIINGACRAGRLTALEAASKLGISLKHLRRLEGRSETFIARYAVKGGAVLYDESAILHLAVVLSTGLRHRDAARQLGIPSHCIEALTSTGLVTPVSDQDANIVTEAPLVTEASIVTLRERLRKRSMEIRGGLTLRKAMERVGDPHDWVAVLQKLLAGHIHLQFDATANLALSDALIVRAVDIARYVSRRSDGPGINGIKVCCETAAKIIGTMAQFVSEAVKAGFIDGQVGMRNSAIPLHGVLKIRENFIFTDELRKTFGRHTKTIATELRKAGLRPAAKINRTNAWWRSDIQRYIAKEDATCPAGD